MTDLFYAKTKESRRDAETQREVTYQISASLRFCERHFILEVSFSLFLFHRCPIGRGR